MEHYDKRGRAGRKEIKEIPQAEADEIYDIFAEYGVSRQEASAVVDALQRDTDSWRDFMMKFELGLEKPDPSRALKSALTIAVSYIVGGIIPLFPYIRYYRIA